MLTPAAEAAPVLPRTLYAFNVGDPVAPVGPVTPVGPVPVGPVAPVGPVGPVAPWEPVFVNVQFETVPEPPT